MDFRLFFTVVFLSSLSGGVCEELVGYSLLANDLLKPLSSTTASSPNPFRNLFGRQARWCTAGNPYVVCPTPRTCCNARDNCTPWGCCPKIAQTCGGKTCAEPGAVCCGSLTCRPGGTCKRSPGGRDACCSAVTDVPCDSGYCCPAGSTCFGGNLCRRTLSSTSRRLSTSRTLSPTTSNHRTSTVRRPSATATLKSKKISSCALAPTSAPTGIGARNWIAVEDETECVLATATGKSKKTSSCASTPTSAPTGVGAWDWVAVEGETECVPVLDFLCVDDLFDQMCTSMCQGIRDQKRINPEIVINDRTILLHKRQGRNAASGCGNMGCAQRVTYSGLYNRYFTMQCDEFPPASSMEGGGPTLTCISWYQNNLGGKYLQYFYSDLNLVQDQPFLIRMDSCDFPKTPTSFPQGSEPDPNIFLPKRQVDDETSISAADDPLWVPDPRLISEGYIFMPLEAGNLGTYNASLSLSNIESLEDVCILDGAGGLVWGGPDVVFSAGLNHLQYEVQDDTQDLFVAASASRNVSVRATFTAIHASQTIASSDPDSGAPPGSGMYLLRLFSCFLLCLICQ